MEINYSFEVSRRKLKSIQRLNDKFSRESPKELFISIYWEVRWTYSNPQSVNHQNFLSVIMSVNQSVSQSVSQSVNYSLSQSVSQSVNYSVSQSVSQSINQCIINPSLYWLSKAHSFLIDLIWYDELNDNFTVEIFVIMYSKN